MCLSNVTTRQTGISNIPVITLEGRDGYTRIVQSNFDIINECFRLVIYEAHQLHQKFTVLRFNACSCSEAKRRGAMEKILLLNFSSFVSVFIRQI